MSGRRRKRWLLVLLAVVLGLAVAGVGIEAWIWQWTREPAGDGIFLVKPYLQWGPQAQPGPGGGCEVLWQAPDRDERWALEVQEEADPDSTSDSNSASSSSSSPEAKGPWIAAGAPTGRRVAIEGVAPRRLYRAMLPAGAPGGWFQYRLGRDNVVVFKARAHRPWTEPHPHRFVVFGDGGADTWAQRAVAYQAYQARPDFVFLAGDLVYYKGSFAEYLHHFFPIYNSNEAAPRAGAPLLRQTLVLAAAGNHDMIGSDLDRCPDGLAFYLLWSLPLNGPLQTSGMANTPVLKGSQSRQRAFLDLAGPAYPRMANYAFDYGGAHWTVLDTNAHTDWTDPALRAWLARDLGSDAARRAAWRFVAFHQPPFHSSTAHAEEQRSRVLVDLFEEAGVDLVFSGHVHNYQRTYPMRFVAAKSADGKNKGWAVSPDGRVPGRWTLDKAYDGVTQTRPDGIIYIISGGGGARLYSSGQNEDAASFQDFTARFIANTHSLTIVDVTADRLTLRQVSDAGKELDRFVVIRGEPAGAGGGAGAAPP